ncbi:hypothetical protein IBL38_18925 [Pseudomonas syringae pv. syringae]|uniref:hypothetical protein n=1 Tax=Pseudomonas syringae TaxID=317 RepID=UPI00165A07C0|nr:hypothetical protein [Pseudomonas syringae]MBC9745057.1 hypothetical protein [Pseudomonas syringae pv. syringae]MBC9749365.1 hypothetical protein [Pseudomonas syringae pv. syringae]MCK9724259.1 hypothetical protein [Pseudomonas syringae pv. syringae]
MELAKVFGVAKDPVESYIEREKVDSILLSALPKSQQIIIYGSSKQGKTALLQRHIPESQRVTVHCGPTMSAEDLYRSFLRQQNIEVKTETVQDYQREMSTSISAKFTALVPFFGGGEAETKGEVKATRGREFTTVPIEFNLSVAQDVGELLKRVESDKFFHVIENFHYLSDDVQRQLAFDLRTFEEMGLRFIILGVWRERNRLVQYNGDLQDRVIEVPVEPWDTEDFQRVFNQGAQILNVSVAPPLLERIYNEAHGSVAVVQELLKKLCEKSGLLNTAEHTVLIDDSTVLDEAISEKISEYAARHVRSLESIAAGSRTRRATEDVAALYLPYYLVNIMVRLNYGELKDGIERKALQTLIQQQHRTPLNVRTSDVTGMLLRLSSLQAAAHIVPPLFDFDTGTRRLKVVDSTLYFFIDNCDPDEVMAEIPNPDPDAV